MYSNELRMTTAAIAMTRNVKKTAKLSMRTVFQNASPGDFAMNHVDTRPATAPMKPTTPSVLWLFSSSTSGSSTMIRIPKSESTISGRMRR